MTRSGPTLEALVSPSPLPRPGRWLAALLFAAALAGCNRPAASPSVTATKQADPTEEMIESVRETLRKSSDLNACRRLVEQLNVYLSRSGTIRKPEPLSAAERAALEKEVALQPEEVAEVARPEFTPLDAHYLNETILFRDVARNLNVGQLPPAERAAAALAWVVRNFRHVKSDDLALPPMYAALRGTGTPLERTYVLLTLLRQLGLDACLVGDSGVVNADGIWAVGVLADGQVYLYDVRLGLPLPAPSGQGTATLAQVRGEADPFKPLALDPNLKYDVTAERAKQAQVYVSVPMTSLSPRMRFLQGLIPEGVIRLTADPNGLRERLRKALSGPAFAGVEVHFWNPPKSEDALPRLLHAFLPPNEGGGDKSEPAKQRLRRYYLDAIPWARLPSYLLELQGEPGSRIQSAFAARITLLSQPGQARDLVHRGQFEEATEQLVALRSQLSRREFGESEIEDSSRKWADTAIKYYAELVRAERAAEKGDPAAIAAREDIQTKIDILWKGSKGPLLSVELAAKDPLQAESVYLLAQCKHEQAEQVRLQRRAAADPATWQAALNWWTQFINTYATSPAALPARRNQAFALEAAGRKEEARAAFAALAGADLTALEKLACKYWESRLKK